MKRRGKVRKYGRGLKLGKRRKKMVGNKGKKGTNIGKCLRREDNV